MITLISLIAALALAAIPIALGWRRSVDEAGIRAVLPEDRGPLIQDGEWQCFLEAPESDHLQGPFHIPGCVEG